MGEIFKTYYVQGKYGKELTKNDAYNLGRAISKYLDAKSMVVGYDNRKSSLALFEGLTKGIIDQGTNVYNIGLVSIPITYFANSFLESDGSIMITGGDESFEINGFKISKKNSIPLYGEDLEQIKNIYENESFSKTVIKAQIMDKEIKNEYYNQVLSFFKAITNLSIVCDYSNSTGIIETYALNKIANMIPINEALDKEIVRHEPNITQKENYGLLGQKVRENNADFGVIFNGDSKKIGFVDEFGNRIQNDSIAILLSREFLEDNSQNIIFDVASTKHLEESINEFGGNPIKTYSGTPFIKEELRNKDSDFGFKSSGNFIYKYNYFNESPSLTIIFLINIIDKSKKSISELIKQVKKYAKSDEILMEIEDQIRVLKKLKVFYYKGDSDFTHGLTLNFKDWWFNIRSSNTKKALRLNIEAKNKDVLKEKKYELLKNIEKILSHEI